jgi:hypothetical protein
MAKLIKTLEEVEHTVKPNPHQHWVIPGSVRPTLITILTGQKDRFKDILIADMVLSMTAFTPFAGYKPPLLATDTLFITDNLLETARILRKLIEGYNITEAPKNLLLIDESTLPSTTITPEFIKEVQKDVQTIVTNVSPSSPITTNIAKEAKTHGLSVIIGQPSSSDKQIADIELLYFNTKNLVTNTQHTVLTTKSLQDNNNQPIVYVRITETANTIQLKQLPFTDDPISKIELEVWTTLQNLGPSTIKILKSALTKNKSKADFVPDVLASLKEKELVTCEDQNTRLGKTKIWAIKLIGN